MISFCDYVAVLFKGILNFFDVCHPTTLLPKLKGISLKFPVLVSEADMTNFAIIFYSKGKENVNCRLYISF